MTRPEAHAILNAAREGQNVARGTIIAALRVTGDLDTPAIAYWKARRHANRYRPDPNRVRDEWSRALGQEGQTGEAAPGQCLPGIEGIQGAIDSPMHSDIDAYRAEGARWGQLASWLQSGT